MEIQAWLWLESHFACEAYLLANDNSVLNLIRNAADYFDEVIFQLRVYFYVFISEERTKQAL
jgi:hypothetical protein